MPEEVAVQLVLWRHRLAATSLQIEGAGVEQHIELTEEPVEHLLRVTARPGATRLTLTTEGRPAEDGRVLAFCAQGEAAIAALA